MRLPPLLGPYIVLPVIILATGTTSSPLLIPQESYTEHLQLRPLPDGKVNAHLQFETHLVRDARSLDHHSLSPSPLLALLDAHDAHAFTLALTAGLWDHVRWGYPLGDTGGTGAELWAWMRSKAEDERSVLSKTEDERYEALMQALSGLFCASLGQALTNTFTTRPYVPHLSDAYTPIPYHTTSPPSGLCTENLTPFLKLLPSKGRSGLASLLRPHRVFGSNWHSMKVHVSREEEERRDGLMRETGGKGVAGLRMLHEEKVKIVLSFEVVWDMVGRKQTGGAVREMSLNNIFHRQLEAVFPPASKTSITVILPPSARQGGDWMVESLSSAEVAGGSDGAGRIISWDINHSSGRPFDFQLSHRDATPFIYPTSYTKPALSLLRTHQGTSQTSGRFHTLIFNTSPFNRSAVLMEEWPWWVGPFLSERKILVNGFERDDLLASQSYTPSIPHIRPSTLLSELHLPANSTVSVTIPFLKQFLKYNEHPPDAARGFELTSAVLFPIELAPSAFQANAGAVPERIYSSNLLMDLATPDFSMPYNVIIMSSTLLALFFGSIFNLLTRRMVYIRVDKQPLTLFSEAAVMDSDSLVREKRRTTPHGATAAEAVLATNQPSMSI